jgi:hypothetical protein
MCTPLERFMLALARQGKDKVPLDKKKELLFILYQSDQE